MQFPEASFCHWQESEAEGEIVVLFHATGGSETMAQLLNETFTQTVFLNEAKEIPEQWCAVLLCMGKEDWT